MDRIAVLTDSVSCLPVPVAQHFSIGLIPVRLRVGAAVYEDLEPGLTPEVVRRLQDQPVIDTTPWPPERYCNAYLDAAREADCIVHVVAFSRFTSTMSLAKAGADAARARQPGLRIELVDSGSVGMAQGFAAMAAARAAAGGIDLDGVVALARMVSRRARSVFALDSLRYLARTGRAASLSNWATSLLKVTPVVALHDGEGHPIALARSPALALRRLAQAAEALARDRGPVHLAVMESSRRPEADDLARTLSSILTPVECHVVPASPAVQAVAGPGLIGLALYTDSADTLAPG